MAVLLEMESNLNLSANKQDVTKLTSKYLTYMRKAKEMCRNVWARFDNSLMLIGSLQVLFTLILQTMSVLGVISSPSSYCTLLAQCVLTTVSLLLSYLSINPEYSMIILTMLSTIAIVCCSAARVATLTLSKVDTLAVVFLVVLGLGSLSNSLLVYEDRTSYFIIQSVVLAIWLKHIIEFLKRDQLKKRERDVQPSTYLGRVLKSPTTYLVIVLSLTLKFSQIFRACREEQAECEVSLFFTPLSSLRDELATYKNLRFWLMSVPAVAIPVMVIKRMLTVRGNLNGNSPLAMFAIYILPLMSLLVLLDWATGATPMLVDWQRTLFARALYVCAILAVCTTFIWPKAIFYTNNRTKSVPYNGSVSSLYNYMKNNLGETETEESRSLVYGLSTVCSATYMILGVAFLLWLMMIAGDGMAFSLFLLLISLLTFLDLHRLTSVQRGEYVVVHISLG